MRCARLAAVVLALALGGCASISAPHPADPLQGWNRSVQGFNDAVDEALLKPVATAYRDVVPEFARERVGNFFGNLGDGWSAVNQLLQGKVGAGLDMTLRLATNTVFGVGGLFDPATDMGLDRRSEDFGQTLGRWGVAPGPYLVLPLLGPSTLRDTAALPLDWSATSVSLVTGNDDKLFTAATLGVIQGRADLLAASRLFDEIAFDRYSFLRDAYLARRRNLVYDGNPPEEPEPAR